MNTELKYVLELTYDELYWLENSILITMLKLKETKAMNEFRKYKNNLKYHQSDELTNKNRELDENILNIGKELVKLEKFVGDIRSIRESTITSNMKGEKYEEI